MQTNHKLQTTRGLAFVLVAVLILAVTILLVPALRDKLASPPRLPLSQPGPDQSLNMKLIKQLGGGISTGQLRPLVAEGNYIYAGIGPRLAILDISQLPQIVLVGQTETISDNIGEVVLAGHYVYVAPGGFGDEEGNPQRLHVVDVADPAQPRIVGFYAPQGEKVRSVRAAGNRLYVTARITGKILPASTESLYVLDLSNPSLPREKGSYSFPSGISDLAVTGNYVYVATGKPGLQVLDVSRPEQPKLVKGLYPSSGGIKLALEGNRLYYYSFDKESLWSLHILGLNNPSNPSETGGSNLGFFADQMFLSGSALYFPHFPSEDVTLLDVSTANAPRILGKQDFGGRVVMIQGPLAFVWQADQLRLFDLSSLPKHVELGVYTSLIPDDTLPELHISGSKGIVPVDKDLFLLDLTNPISPAVANRFNLPDYFWIDEVIGDLVYGRSDLSGRFEALDISDMARPRVVWTHDGWDSNNNRFTLAVAGKSLFLINPVSGFYVFDNTNPTVPRLIGRQPELKGFGDTGTHVAVSKGRLYLLDGRAINIFDISNPAKVAELGSFAFPSSGSGYETITVIDNFAFLDNSLFDGTDPATLAILDVSDPATPSLIASYYWGEYSSIQGDTKDRVFIDDWTGVHVVDFSNAKAPKEIGYYGLSQWGTGSSSMDLGMNNLVYAVSYPNGLYVFQFTGPASDR